MSFLDETCGHFTVPHKLLEATTVEAACAEFERGGQAKKNDQDREVDVESVGYHIQHFHVAHDLSVKSDTSRYDGSAHA